MKKVLILIMLILSACSDSCIEPGMGISSSDIDIDVPVLMEGASESDKSSQWVDSGVSIKKDESITLRVSGVINLCADEPKKITQCTNNKLCSERIVPSVFCSDGSSPRYDSSDKEKVESHDPSVICAHSGGKTSRYGYYIDSGITVNPEDQVRFSLVPSQVITIDDCYNIPSTITQYVKSDLQKLYSDAKKKADKTPELAYSIDDIINKKLYDICESGVNFIETGKYKGKTTYIRLGPFKGKKYEVYVNNSFTPWGNKVYTESDKKNKPNGEKNFYGAPATSNKNAWQPASLADARDLFKYNEYDYECDKPSDPELLRFNTYDVNYRCKNICREDKIWENNCVSTLRYKWDKKIDDNCKKYRSVDKCRKKAFPIEKWADLLIARVGGNSGNMANDHGKQCLPNNKKNADCMSWHSTQKDNSLQLDIDYTVLDDVPSNSKVWLGTTEYSNAYFNNTGGYHVRVDRSCIRTNGKELYVYIGDNPNSVVPGDSSTDHMYMEPKKCDAKNGKSSCTQKVKTVTITGGSSDKQKTGKIFFGIKGALESDTVKNNYDEDKNNKYTVKIYKTKWNPIFSKFFSKVRNTILEVLYGLPFDTQKSLTLSNVDIRNSDGLITKTYNNIINNGLVQFVQALLVLYIAFSGLAFMLGLIQKTQMELIIRVIKIGVVLTVISPGSWNFFGVQLFNLFVKGVDQIAGFFSGMIGGDDAFAFLDPTVGALLTSEFWKRLASIMWSGPVGFFSFILLLWGIGIFFTAIIESIIAYLMSMIALSLLLSLAPLFIICILFKITKTLFDAWIKMFLSVSLMPIILFSTLAFLHQIMMSAFYTINNFSACKGCIMDFSFKIGETAFKLCPIKLLVPSTYVYNYDYRHYINQIYATGGENFFGLPFNLTAIIIFVISAFAMKTFVHIADNMSKDIAGSMEPNLLHAAMGATQALASVVGQDQQTKQLREQALGGESKGRNQIEFRPESKGKVDEHVDKAGQSGNASGAKNDGEGEDHEGRKGIEGPTSSIMTNEENHYEQIAENNEYEVPVDSGQDSANEQGAPMNFDNTDNNHYEPSPDDGHYKTSAEGGSATESTPRFGEVSGMPNLDEKGESQSAPSEMRSADAPNMPTVPGEDHTDHLQSERLSDVSQETDTGEEKIGRSKPDAQDSFDVVDKEE